MYFTKFILNQKIKLSLLLKMEEVAYSEVDFSLTLISSP